MNKMIKHFVMSLFSVVLVLVTLVSWQRIQTCIMASLLGLALLV